MQNKVHKAESLVPAGKTQGGVVNTFGWDVAFISIPDGMVASRITLRGTFDGTYWFPIVNESGVQVVFSTLIKNPIVAPGTLNAPTVPPGTLNPNPAVLPIPKTARLEGVPFLMAITNQPDKSDQRIGFYLVEEK
jgi:hypothetical protein